jgi:hypothetical protein
MDTCHLQIDITNLLAVITKSVSTQIHHPLKKLDARVVISLLGVNTGHDLVDLAVRRIVLPLELFVHLETLLQQRYGVSEVASLEVALAELVEDESVVVTCFTDVLEKLSVNF